MTEAELVELEGDCEEWIYPATPPEFVGPRVKELIAEVRRLLEELGKFKDVYAEGLMVGRELGRSQEREACARRLSSSTFQPHELQTVNSCIALIRARGET
jgi:hypothetical protein